MATAHMASQFILGACMRGGALATPGDKLSLPSLRLSGGRVTVTVLVRPFGILSTFKPRPFRILWLLTSPHVPDNSAKLQLLFCSCSSNELLSRQLTATRRSCVYERPPLRLEGIYGKCPFEDAVSNCTGCPKRATRGKTQSASVAPSPTASSTATPTTTTTCGELPGSACGHVNPHRFDAYLNLPTQPLYLLSWNALIMTDAHPSAWMD